MLCWLEVIHYATLPESKVVRHWCSKILSSSIPSQGVNHPVIHFLRLSWPSFTLRSLNPFTLFLWCIREFFLGLSPFPICYCPMFDHLDYTSISPWIPHVLVLPHPSSQVLMWNWSSSPHSLLFHLGAACCWKKSVISFLIFSSPWGGLSCIETFSPISHPNKTYILIPRPLFHCH